MGEGNPQGAHGARLGGERSLRRRPWGETRGDEGTFFGGVSFFVSSPGQERAKGTGKWGYISAKKKYLQYLRAPVRWLSYMTTLTTARTAIYLICLSPPKNKQTNKQARPPDLVGSWALEMSGWDGLSDLPLDGSSEAEDLGLNDLVVAFRKDGTVEVPVEKGVGLQWKVEPGPTHLDTVYFKMISAAPKVNVILRSSGGGADAMMTFQGVTLRSKLLSMGVAVRLPSLKFWARSRCNLPTHTHHLSNLRRRCLPLLSRNQRGDVST